MKTKSNYWDYKLFCAGRYTSDNILEQIKDPIFESVHRLIEWVCFEDVPHKAPIVRADLEPRERIYSYGFKRPATLFELVWFARRFPDFFFLHGSIETYFDPYLHAYMRRKQRRLNVAVVRYCEELDGLELTLDEYDKQRKSDYLLVAPYVS
ncbi:MAG: hypothetical protein RLZZ517_25 [Candidatus Parcubacteria bacterium]|jgi:hypothetical protein